MAQGLLSPWWSRNMTSENLADSDPVTKTFPRAQKHVKAMVQ